MSLTEQKGSRTKLMLWREISRTKGEIVLLARSALYLTICYDEKGEEQKERNMKSTTSSVDK